jgi:hypothetical protein
MARKFSTDVLVEMFVGGNSVDIMATIDFEADPPSPASFDLPGDGGEIIGKEVAALFIPEVKAREALSYNTMIGSVLLKHNEKAAEASPEIRLDCPQ